MQLCFADPASFFLRSWKWDLLNCVASGTVEFQLPGGPGYLSASRHVAQARHAGAKLDLNNPTPPMPQMDIGALAGSRLLLHLLLPLFRTLSQLLQHAHLGGRNCKLHPCLFCWARCEVCLYSTQSLEATISESNRM